MFKLLTAILCSTILSYCSWHIHPVFSFVKFLPLFYILTSQNKKGIILSGIFLYFLQENITTSYWLMYYSIPKAVLLYTIIASLYALPIFALYKFTAYKHRYYPIALLPLLLALIDITHPYFSFNTTLFSTGYIFATTPQYIQWYQYTGSVGGTLWVALINVLIYTTLSPALKKRATPLALSILALIILTTIIPTLSCFHFHQKETNTQQLTVAHALTSKTNDPNLIDSLYQQTSNVDLLILPEGFFYNDVWTNPEKDKKITTCYDKVKAKGAKCLITGVNLNIRDKDGPLKTTLLGRSYAYKSYNAAIKYESDINTVKVKKVLIPFEEYIPQSLSFLGSWFHLKSDSLSTHENNGNSFSIGQSNALILVCYEVVHSSFIANSIRDEDQFIVLLTSEDFIANNKKGLEMYMNIIRTKAIEFHKYIVKSSYKGIAACINHKGEIINSSGMYNNELLISSIKQKNGKTLYCYAAPYIKWVLMLIISGAVFAIHIKK